MTGCLSTLRPRLTFLLHHLNYWQRMARSRKSSISPPPEKKSIEYTTTSLRLQRSPPMALRISVLTSLLEVWRRAGWWLFLSLLLILHSLLFSLGWIGARDYFNMDGDGGYGPLKLNRYLGRGKYKILKIALLQTIHPQLSKHVIFPSPNSASPVVFRSFPVAASLTASGCASFECLSK